MIRECFKCGTGIIFDAVMLQQLGLNVHLDKHGSPVLGEQPSRMPLDPADTITHNAQPWYVWALVKGLWGAFTFPVTYVHDVLRQSRSHTKHAHLESKRHTLPVRVHGAAYKLMPFTPEEGAFYEAQQEQEDAKSKMNDQLSAAWMWRILEWIPMRVKRQKAIIQMVDNSNGYTWV